MAQQLDDYVGFPIDRVAEAYGDAVALAVVRDQLALGVLTVYDRDERRRRTLQVPQRACRLEDDGMVASGRRDITVPKQAREERPRLPPGNRPQP